MKIIAASISLLLLLLQIMSFADGEKRVDIVFHHYLNPHHLQLFHQFKCCCKNADCSNKYNNTNITCESLCNTYFSVCFKENTLSSSRVCYNTTKPTDVNTTLIPFTTPNIVQFIINNESMTLENTLLTIEITNENPSPFLIDFYSIDINQTTLKRAIYIGSKGNSQIDISILMLSFSCNYYATNCTERENEYSHYICDHYGNKTCRNSYINPENTCKCNSSLIKTTWTTSSTSISWNISPSASCQNDDFWEPIAIVSLTFCFLLVLSWIILIIAICSCKLKMKRKDDRVDTGNSSGINNVAYTQPIICTTGVYISSTIEDKPVDTCDTHFNPHSMSTAGVDYTTFFDDNVHVSDNEQ